MLDDGEIERRVRLIRPMEQHSVPLKMMAESHWVEADRERFSTAWLAELAEVPEFSESTIHIVAGLLLPIWKRLPNESTRVYRLQTDAGERIIGRKVSAAWVANVLAAGAPDVGAGRSLRRAAGGSNRSRPRRRPPASPRPGHGRTTASNCPDSPTRCAIDCAPMGSSGRSSPGSCACSCRSDASGVEVLAKVLDRYPIERIAEREAA